MCASSMFTPSLGESAPGGQMQQCLTGSDATLNTYRFNSKLKTNL